MILSKEQLLSISGLALSGVIDSMSALQYADYCKALTNFIEVFPTHEATLKDAFNIRDYGTFSVTFSKLREILKKIHAIGLEQSCRRLLDEFSSKKYTIVEAHMNYLMAEISGLSIDIQMAQRENELADAAQENANSNEAAVAEAREKTILAVDDVSLMLFALKSILQKTDYKFVGVNSGESALKYAAKNTPDLFILDIEMPNMNGYELMRKLRMRGQKAPVIFLTGNASAEYVHKALTVGAADFIVKPVNESQVLEKIRKHIR